MAEGSIPIEAQIEALAHGKIHSLLAANGIETFGPAKFLRVSRCQMIEFFQRHPEVAKKHVSESSQRPFHDHLCLERRGSGFVIFDMDHGKPRGELLYDSLPEAACDFVAFEIGYKYPSG
jgi:hypothetical protein